MTTKVKDPIGSRLKGNYELRQTQYLTRRTPVIVRLDGCHFHTYCSSLKNRFHQGFMDTMDLTAMYLCENIMGAQVAYVQSDEISILLHDYKTLQSEAWYDYNQQKVTSVSASMAGAYFTKESWRIWSDYRKPYYSLLYDSQHLATFDSRAFNLPEAEVCNYFIWRQLDCVRNSINSLGQSHYSARQLHGKSQSDVQEMCFQAGYNWNDLPTAHRRGRCIVKVNYDYEGTTRSKWIVDSEIPKFTEDREYIERYLKSES